MSKSKTGTKEWAEINRNLSSNKASGCPNDCLYCYAKYMAIKFGRSTVTDWQKGLFDPEKINQQVCKGKEVMFPSAHDITPDNLSTCLHLIERLLEKDNKVLIVNKGVKNYDN
ncbi:MAG: hypothetical protein LBK68_03565 [Candidatus Margulisbacteria bacterium]|jgi:DNA repair photolyase|nr:hypothetical protein [Candidatus Margulisiibacteriota bacterium]